MSIYFIDQPPAYPNNDKPPDYHDVCPPKSVTPPPVNVPTPDSTPAARVSSPIINSSGVTVHIAPSDNTTPLHIPTFNSLSQALNYHGNMRTVPTQPPNVSSDPINIIFSARSHGLYNNSSTTTTGTQPSNGSSTGYPPENIVLTQPPTYNSHLYNAAEVSESNA